MKDSKLNAKKLKIDFNRILVSDETSYTVNCILISIVKKLTGFAVHIKYEKINFRSLQVMYDEKFIVESLESANSFSMRAEAYFMHMGFSRLKDSSMSNFKLRSRIGDELSRGWKVSSCDEDYYFFDNHEIQRLKNIHNDFGKDEALDNEMYAASVQALKNENYKVEDHSSCVFNCYVDIILNNDYVWDAVCLDNSGYEEEFDLNVSYMIDGSTSSEFLKVYDKFGVKQELSNSRFRVEISTE
jgi:hypothetical protein